MIRLFSLVLLLFPFCAPAKDLYQIQPLSGQDILHTYTLMLRDACHYADQGWKSLPSNSSQGYWGDGVSVESGGARTIGGMVLACAALVKYDDGLNPGQRRELLDKITAALRYATATHFTGPQMCIDGKHWGGLDRPGSKFWQTSYWTSSFACGAWLVWDQLDPALQHDIQRVVAAQDDLMTRGEPPNGLWLDTKAEENGWDVPCLVLGELMFPNHPHAAVWHETAIKYMMNTLCTSNDLFDTNLVDGRPVNQWVRGANLQPDFTLENHNIFHPSYVACSSYFLTQAAMYYTFAGRPIPQAAGHHLLDTWRMFQTVLLPWGEAAYPQGMDWELHGLSYINLFASLATHWQDPLAARMEQQNLQYTRAWQMMRQGGLAVPGSPFGIPRHSVTAEQVAYAFLAHKIFGPAAAALTANEAAARVEGVYEHPYIQFIIHRTGEKFASFSWKNRIMGLLMPVGPGHEGNPEFTVPITNGFVGSFVLAHPDKAQIKVIDHSWKTTPDGFVTAGTLLLNRGRLKQTLKVTSIGDTVVYEDHVTAVSNVTVQSERGVPLGIENDEISGGARTVSDEAGPTNFDWKTPVPPVALPGTWADVDGRLGIVMVAGSGLAYAQATGYAHGISVCEDILYGSSSDHRKHFQAGDEVAHRVAVFYVEVAPEAMPALAQSCKIETTPGGQELHFKQADGKDAAVPLL